MHVWMSTQLWVIGGINTIREMILVMPDVCMIMLFIRYQSDT